MKIKCIAIAGLCMAMLAGCDRDERSSESRRRTTSVPKRVSRRLPSATADRTSARSAVDPTPTRQREESASCADFEELQASATYRWAVAYIKRIDTTLDHDGSGKNEEN